MPRNAPRWNASWASIPVRPSLLISLRRTSHAVSTACVINIIAFNKAYALFPEATFEERVSLVMLDLQSYEGKALAKYSQRGWVMVSRIWPHHAALNSSFALGSCRWVGDKRTWVLHLNMDGITLRPRVTPSSAEFHLDPVEQSTWMLDVHGESMGVGVFGTVLWSRTLRYEYLVLDNRLHLQLREFCDQQYGLERLKAGRSDPTVLTWQVAQSFGCLVGPDRGYCRWDSVLPSFIDAHRRNHPDERIPRDSCGVLIKRV